MNFLDAEVMGHGADGVRVRALGASEIVVPVQAGARGGTGVILGIRPEHVTLAPAEAATLSGEVLVV